MQRKVSNFLILKRAKEELIQINDSDNEINDLLNQRYFP